MQGGRRAVCGVLAVSLWAVLFGGEAPGETVPP